MEDVGVEPASIEDTAFSIRVHKYDVTNLYTVRTCTMGEYNNEGKCLGARHDVVYICMYTHVHKNL